MEIYYFTTKDENNLFQIQSEQKVSYITFDTCYSSKSRTLKMPDQLKVTTSDALCIIPTIIDQTNAYTYDGVELALRCYFDFFNRGLKKFWFLLTGIEHESSFWKHCKYSNILKLPNVRYVYNNRLEIERFLGRFSPNLDIDWNECKEIVKTISIDRPASYQSSHSVTNEWSIYRWSKQLGIDNIAIDNEIDELLYFNYLKTIFHETDIKNTNNFVFSTKGKVLLIDDEVGKGWGKFFDCFCKELTFSSIGEDFKKATSQQKIIDIAAEKVEGFDPDVVILDLRLMDNDFEDAILPEQLTGAMIFNKIKEINRGIQVIIFSASNKIWNYYHIDHDGIILKESPEQSGRPYYTQKSICELNERISYGIQRAIFLKQTNKLLIRANEVIHNKFKKIAKLSEDDVESAFALVKQYFHDDHNTLQYLGFAYQRVFNVIERVIECHISKDPIEYAERAVWVKYGQIKKAIVYVESDKTHYRLSKDGARYTEKTFETDIYNSSLWNNSNYKMAAILKYCYDIDICTDRVWDIWDEVRDNRNTKTSAHPQKGQNYIHENDFFELLHYLLFLINDCDKEYLKEYM